MTLRHPGGHKDVHYSYEAGIRGNSLVLLSDRKGEAATKVVFPTFKKDFSDDASCGFTFHENWDREEAVDPAMILSELKYPVDASGRLSDEDSSAIEKEWLENFFQIQARGIPVA